MLCWGVDGDTTERSQDEQDPWVPGAWGPGHHGDCGLLYSRCFCLRPCTLTIKMAFLLHLTSSPGSIPNQKNDSGHPCAWRAQPSFLAMGARICQDLLVVTCHNREARTRKDDCQFYPETLGF